MMSWRIAQFIALLPLGTGINRVLVKCFQVTMGSYDSKGIPASRRLASCETSAWVGWTFLMFIQRTTIVFPWSEPLWPRQSAFLGVPFTFFILNLRLDVFNRIAGLDIECDRFSCECFDKNLHNVTESMCPTFIVGDTKIKCKDWPMLFRKFLLH